MKYISLSMILFHLFTGFAYCKSLDYPSDQFSCDIVNLPSKQRIERLYLMLDFLHELRYESNRIYVISLSHVYIQSYSAFTSDELEDAIKYDIPYLKKELSFFQEHENLFKEEYSQLQRAVSQLADNADQIILGLKSYPDYEDINNKRKYENVLYNDQTAAHSIIDKIIFTCLRDLESEFYELANERRRFKKYISKYRCLSVLYELRDFNQYVYGSMIKWIYMPSLLDNRDEFGQVLRNRLNKFKIQISSDLECLDSDKIAIVKSQLQEVLSISDKIMDDLRHNSDYEDSLSKLMAEDKLEANLQPIYSRLKDELNQLYYNFNK